MKTTSLLLSLTCEEKIKWKKELKTKQMKNNPEFGILLFLISLVHVFN